MINPTFYDQLTSYEAITLQKQMRENICIQPLLKNISLIGGADVSFNKFEETIYAGIIVLSYPEMIPVAKSTVISTTKFPYIPGLLAFREVPALVKAWEQLSVKPDILIVDGHGIAHNRRLGIATHFGLMMNVPTIGCAKSKLTGIYSEPGYNQFSESPLVDRKEQIGTVLRTKLRCKPVFISPGHKVSMRQSVDIIKNCVRGYRLPEPTRLAHNLVNEVRITNKGTPK